MGQLLLSRVPPLRRALPLSPPVRRGLLLLPSGGAAFPRLAVAALGTFCALCTLSTLGAVATVTASAVAAALPPLATARVLCAALATPGTLLALLGTHHAVAAFRQAAQLHLYLLRIALLRQGRGGHQLHLVVLQPLGILLAAVLLDDFLHALGGDGHEVVFALVCIPHHAAEHVGFLIQRQALLEADGLPGGRELLQRVGIHLILKIEAALQLAALPRKLLRVGHDLLRLGRRGGDRLEVGEPRRAAELAPAGAQAAHFARLLAHADLLHLDAHVELVGKHLDEHAEVHALVGSVVEDGF